MTALAPLLQQGQPVHVQVAAVTLHTPPGTPDTDSTSWWLVAGLLAVGAAGALAFQRVREARGVMRTAERDQAWRREMEARLEAMVGGGGG